MPLSVIRDGATPGEPWKPSDRLLAVALTIHDGDICGGCGHYKDEAWGEDAHSFEREAVLCHACAAIESDKADDKTPGEKVFAVDARAALNDPTETAPRFD